MSYDSEDDTRRHILRVGQLLEQVVGKLNYRAVVHDVSKLGPEEKPLFDAFTPLLASTEYGSEEYNEALKGLKPALDHHYAQNSHHPEHYDTGIAGMTLLDLIEMLADWKAASERHENGDLLQSMLINRKRFKISGELYEILLATVGELGWYKENDDEA